MPELDSRLLIDGTFCKAHMDGEWLSNIDKATVKVIPSFESIKRAGTRWEADKLVGLKGEGSIAGFLVTTKLIEARSAGFNDEGPLFLTELIFEIADPSNPAMNKFLLIKNVQFKDLTLLDYQVGSVVKDESPFSFQKYEWITNA